MINLFHYLIGENLNIKDIFESSQNDRNELRKLINNWFKSHNEKMSSTKQETPKELFRYPLGEGNEALNKLKEILKDIDDITINDDEPKIVGRSAGGSGTYKSYSIKYKGDIYFIANTTQDKANLKNKELTPDKLKLSNDNYIYKSFDELYNKLKPSLDDINKKYPESGIYELLNELINKIKSGDYEKSGSFNNNEKIDDFFADNNEGKLSFSINSEYVSKVLDGDIACIEKDFGEILGPFVFFRLFKDVELNYPSASNEPLVDYYINGHKVSAKQLGGGGKPSGASVALAAQKNRKKIIDNPEDITDETTELTNKEKKIIFEPEEIEFIDNVLITYEKSIFEQQRDLISKYVKNINNITLIDFAKLNNSNDLEKELDNILNNTNIETYFTNIYKQINYVPTKTSSWTPKIIAKEYNNLTTKLKWGILFYPLYKTAINNIVKKYGDEKNDIISSVIQKVTDMKQIYLGIRKKKELKIDIVSSAISKWTLTTGGMSTNNISNSKLSIELKH